MSARTARRLLLAGSAAMASIGTAHAQTATGTVAGTTISNTAQASYTVNGTPQITQSNTATFVVDRKVNLTVIADQGGNTQVNQGQTGAVLTFKVTNNTNGTQDFLLSPSQLVPAGVLTGTDNFDVANLRIYVDSNGNGVYDAADTATYIDELGPDASREVFVVADIPSVTTAILAQVGLDATVAAGGAPGTQGAALVPPLLNTINQDNQVDVVFADNDDDGTLGFDTARNGQAWAYAAYEVGTHNVNLTVTKTATVLSDGVGATNPKALPGAVVQYCLTANNATLTAAANGVSLTDVVPANTTYVPGSITIGGLGGAGQCVLNGYPQNDDGSPAAGPYGGGFNAATKTVTATIPTLPGGASVAASFRVTIN